jgi:hypothetical protein
LGLLGTSAGTLTPRRRETLETLRRLVAGAAGPVHYSTVAAAMGISAWTAYGLLRELERPGLVERSYALDSGPKLGGRSRILFAPAILAPAVSFPADLPERLRPAFERFAAIADEGAAARAYLAEAGSDLGFHLGYWLARLETAGLNAEIAARTVLESSARPAAKMQTVAAMGLGAALSRLEKARLATRITAAAAGFSALLDDAQRASEASLAALVDAARALPPPIRRHAL